MAQVLAPIVQTSTPITMLHSSSDAFQTPSAQPHHTQQRSSQMPRSQSYNAQATGAGYRGTAAPIAPYAFSSTPQLRQETRSTSAPNQQALQQQTQLANTTRLGHPTHASSSSDSNASTSGSSSRSLVAPSFTTKEDADFRKSIADSVPSPITLSTTVPDLSLSVPDAPVKPSPGRYRRTAARTDSSNSGSMTAPSSTPTPTQQSPLIGASAPPVQGRLNNGLRLNTIDLLPPARPGHQRASSVDDMHMARGSASEQAKRYRRRSLSSIEAMTTTTSPVAATATAMATANIAAQRRPTSEVRPPSSSSRHDRRPGSSQSHERQGSSGSTTSSLGSTRPSSRHESAPPRSSAGATSVPATKAPEPNRRIAPSPLSQPISPSEPSTPAQEFSEAAVASPAVKQLTALNDKERGMKSRLRRAFSFGSAAELRRASAENNLSSAAKLRKDRYQSEEDAEQAAIVAKQEAAGIGAGIYNGQGGFTSSTDNISISSTASSASIMLRKMGHGMKKGTRSIKGLFRPKSVIGVPAADGPITEPQVSLVTVEAERHKVNVNADPHEIGGGGSGYPRLERNSIDAGRSTDAPSLAAPLNDSMSRKSIIGGDRERAEVLSSIKKGILKRTDTNSETSSPVVRPVDARVADSPKSSAPSTPVNEKNDYFTRPPRLPNPSTRSLPNTPNGSRGNISFSPRIQFYDAWSASDYDRRGDIATCNRLTPMLAQQIKEELNSFKMEMEVHELSKPHTHFF